MSEKIIDVEPVKNEQALQVRESQEIAPSGLFGTQEPLAIIDKASSIATALKSVITKQGLVSRINGKEYPKCEAWTLLGTMLGVFPVLCWSKPLDGGWEARVEARTKDGSIVGAAEAQCLRGERNWKDRDDFALRSMAQTRATAKCLRMPLGFVMTLAGYEATPAEEMAYSSQNAPGSPGAATPPVTGGTPFQRNAAPKAQESAPSQPETHPFATAESLEKMIATLQAGQGQPSREIVTKYFREIAQLLPNEEVEDLMLQSVPATKGQMRLLCERIGDFANGGEAVRAFPPNEEPPKAKGAKAKPIEVPRDPKTYANSDDPDHPEAAWRIFPMPFGKNAGVCLEDLEKNYLFGLWANFKVEREFNGKPCKPEKIERDTEFRAMLDMAGTHYQFKTKE